MKAFHLLGAAPLYTNSFVLISDAGHAVVIDPAAEVQEYDKIFKENNATLTTILCTHGHYDHVGSAGVLSREWKTPGHTEGGVVLLCGDYLFVGDTVFQGSIGRTDLEGGSMQKMDASLRKLAGLPIPKETQLLPGHGDFSTLGEELANNFYIRSALRGGNADF